MNYLYRLTLVIAALALVACAAPQPTPETEETVQVEPETTEASTEQAETDQAGDGVEESLDNTASTNVSSTETEEVVAAADSDSESQAQAEEEMVTPEPEPEPEPEPIVRSTVPAQLQGAEQLLEQKSFFFDFDMSDLKDDSFDALDAHAIAIGLAIAENPSLVVTVEGHADERGTQEYNIALGLRRAEAVSRYLRVKGIPAANLNTISFGEAKPVELGSDEVSWAANRRAVLNY